MKKVIISILIALLVSPVFGATRNVVPRADGEGKIGTTTKPWGESHTGNSSNYVKESTSGTVYTGTTRPQRTYWVNASGFWETTTSGSASPVKIETTTNKLNYYSLAFDGSTDERCEFSTPLPKSWNAGTVSVVIYYIPTGTTGGTGIVWTIAGVSIGDNENIDVAQGTPVSITDTIQTANYVHTAPESGAITIGGTPVGEKFIQWRVTRDADAGGDTNTNDAKLLGVAFKFTATQETDD